jgi:hypothetical protein
LAAHPKDDHPLWLYEPFHDGNVVRMLGEHWRRSIKQLSHSLMELHLMWISPLDFLKNFLQANTNNSTNILGTAILFPQSIACLLRFISDLASSSPTLTCQASFCNCCL